MEARRSDRLLWLTSLLLVIWLLWVETSFQYLERSLGSDLRLDSAGVALVAGSFLLPYGLVQVPGDRFALAMGFAYGLLGVGAAVAAVVPLFGSLRLA